MTYFSVCSGVEAASLAWGKIGWQPIGFCEIEPFPSAVLAARWPSVPNFGDMTKVGFDHKKGIITNGRATAVVPEQGIDILVGGTPCQSFSVAGKREGLRGLSGLCLDYVRLAYEGRFPWFVWENVPGVFSSNGGRDFATFLSYMCGREVGVPEDGWKTSGVCSSGRADRYSIAWRVLDAQYVRVDEFPYAIPQRRRRVFCIGYCGAFRRGGVQSFGCADDATRAAEVLFESQGDGGDCAPRRESVKEVARHFAEGVGDADGVDVGNGIGGVIPLDMDKLKESKNTPESLAKGCRKGGCGFGVGNVGDPAYSVNATDRHAVAVFRGESHGKFCEDIVSGTLDTQHNSGVGNGTPALVCAVAGRQSHGKFCEDIVTRGRGSASDVHAVVAIDRAAYNQGKSALYSPQYLTDGTNPALTAKGPSAAAVDNDARAVRLDMHMNGDFLTKEAQTIRAGASATIGGGGVVMIAPQNATAYGLVAEASESMACEHELSHTVAVNHHCAVILAPCIVRRLLPIECERLMGFPDGHTAPRFTPERIAEITPFFQDKFAEWDAICGNPNAKRRTAAQIAKWLGAMGTDAQPDAPRYKACGNSMCVNCMEWIGRRIHRVETDLRIAESLNTNERNKYNA